VQYFIRLLRGLRRCGRRRTADRPDRPRSARWPDLVRDHRTGERHGGTGQQHVRGSRHHSGSRAGQLLKTTYFSGSSGLADKPESYNVVTYELTPSTDDTTKVSVTRTNNPDQDAADRASANWGMTLTSLKDLLEK
jgi:hypothetical protein